MRYRLRTLLILLGFAPLGLWCLFLLWQWAILPNLGPNEMITETYIEVGGKRYTWPTETSPTQ